MTYRRTVSLLGFVLIVSLSLIAVAEGEAASQSAQERLDRGMQLLQENQPSEAWELSSASSAVASRGSGHQPRPTRRRDRDLLPVARGGERTAGTEGASAAGSEERVDEGSRGGPAQ